MQSTRLYQLIKSLSPVEVREFRKFLQSPFFNTRDDLPVLFERMVDLEVPQKEELWELTNPGEIYDDQRMRLLMSYLYKLLEQYIAIYEYRSDPLQMELDVVKGLKRKGLKKGFEQRTRALEKKLKKAPLRDASFFQKSYQLQWEKYQTATTEDPAASEPLKELARTADLYYLATRLRLMCLRAAQAGVYQAESGTLEEREILAMADRMNWREHPALALYMYGFRMMQSEGEESHFQSFKSLLLQSGTHFSHEEMRGLYLLAINYCIRRLNEGETRFFREVLDLYKGGLAGAYLLENGILSRFTYHNIVAAGLQAGDLAWVDAFIHDFKRALEKKYRERSFSFNLARLEYTRGRLDAVLELLQRANYRDPLLNLAAKTLLLKTYYELDEYDLLQSHLDAMRHYIRRKHVIGYHRTNYMNILRYTEKLLRLNFHSRKEMDAFREAVSREPVLTEKEWFLSII